MGTALRVTHTDFGMGGGGTHGGTKVRWGNWHVIRVKSGGVLNLQRMCIIRGRNGHLVLNLVKNELFYPNFNQNMLNVSYL